MTKEREALKLALDRLERFVDAYERFVDAYPHDITVSKDEFLRPFKQALAQPKTVNQFNPDYADEAINEMTLTIQKQAQRIEELEAQVAQPDQEPVAKVVLNERLKLPCLQWLDFDKKFEFKGGESLYTSPPQRKPQFKEFIKWAGAQGYDCAKTCNSDTGEWVVLSPMTADLWKAWQAAHGIKE